MQALENMMVRMVETMAQSVTEAIVKIETTRLEFEQELKVMEFEAKQEAQSKDRLSKVDRADRGTTDKKAEDLNDTFRKQKEQDRP